MKKIISIVLVISMLLALGITASAAKQPVLSLVTDGFSGDSITVKVNLEHNPGIAFYTLRVKYPSDYLTLTDVSNSGAVISGEISTNKEKADDLGYVDISKSDSKNHTGDGMALTLNFELKDDYDKSKDRTFEFFLTSPKGGDFGGIDESKPVLTMIKHTPKIVNVSATLKGTGVSSSGSGSRPSGGSSSSSTTITWKNASDWAEPELKEARTYNLIPKVLSGTDMKKQITRKEFAAVAVKLYEKLSGKTASAASKDTFKDTTDTDVLKAYKLGITVGMGDGKFEPEFLITREQVATMLYRTISIAKGEKTVEFDKTKVQEFADNAEINDWAYDAVYFMNQKEIVLGVGDNKFDAKSNTTREASLAISVRGYKKLK